MFRSWKSQPSFIEGMLEGRMEEEYTPTAHVRELVEGNFSSKSLAMLSLLGMMVLTVGGSASTVFSLFLRELEFLEEEAMVSRRK